ncbi:MAG: hypothetical protein M1823_004602 [Watsoniomyces obsoletus]|nr:MAG: hypothetical protein M1823_004602 [Watsoniomyces obsoletus]
MATTEVPTSNRPPFESDGAPTLVTDRSSTTNPTSPSSPVLARFEFEAGRGNNGTKILMIEWEDPPQISSEQGAERGDEEQHQGQWQITWPSKPPTTLPAKDESRGPGSHRFYFLLLPNVMIPPVVTLTYHPSSSSSSTTSPESSTLEPNETLIKWHVNPLPAIFPPGLGGTSTRMHGKKGVLHTLWAKKRLEELSREIETELHKNVESVGLEMALQERNWIESNFGIGGRNNPSGLDIPSGKGGMGMVMGAWNGGSSSSTMDPISPSTSTSSTALSFGPGSPKTPGGGSSRLAEKLKGLRVGTSERELLSSRHEPPKPTTQSKGQQSTTTLNNNNNRSKKPKARNAEDDEEEEEEEEEEDDLFAVAMSPRSPDMAKSPFSSLSSTAIGVGRGIGATNSLGAVVGGRK